MTDVSAAAGPGATSAEAGSARASAARASSARAAGAEATLAGDIGRRLAAHRVRRGVRVAELAREVGVTPSLISQIERGQSRPSVSTLFALAQALDVPVDAFFREPLAQDSDAAPGQEAGAAPGQEAGEAQGQGTGAAAGREAGASPRPAPAPGPATPAEGRYVVRRGSRAAVDIEGGVRWERLTRATLDHLDFFELVYQPGAESHPRQYTHPGTEMVLVMSGCLEITVGFERYRLEPGDSIDFPSTMPHRYVNPGTETARAVTVILYGCPDGTGGATEAGHPSLVSGRAP